MRTVGGFWGVLFSFWLAALACVLYAVVGYLFLRSSVGNDQALLAVKFFIFDYGGLIAGTACATLFLMSIFVLRMVPILIEDALPSSEIEETRYHYWKARLNSLKLGLSQFATYFLSGFLIYTLLEFPVSSASQPFITIFSSLQYACGGFVGRKLWCVGHMLRSLEEVNPESHLLDSEALPRLIYVINIFTFLTLVMTVVHTYFHAEISYIRQSEILDMSKSLIYLPLVLAAPVVVLFNFYPRMVVNRLYLKSIRQRKDWLSLKIQEAGETEISMLKNTIDYEKYLNEEFRYRQRVALSELPVALTIVVALAVSIIRVLAK